MVVMASTEESDSSAISSSTTLRSALTRSKISFAVKACPNLPIPMRLSSVAQTQPFKIPGCYSSQLFRRSPADFSQLANRIHQKRRLVALAAVWDRRQIRRVGFDQQPVRRGQPRRLADRLGFGKCQDAAEAQMKSQVQRFPRFGRSAGETMEDAGAAVVLPQNLHRFGPGFPRVDHNWLARLPRQ